MSETEISQTPEGRPQEGPPESRPPESDLPGAASTSAPDLGAAPGVARLAEEPPAGSRKPKIGDTRPARVAPPPPKPAPAPVVPLARPEATAPVEAEIDVAGP